MPLLYLSTPDPLPVAAQRVFGALGVKNWEERDSDNYPGGNYFRGEVGAFEVTVSRESPDDPFHDDFPVLVLIDYESTVPTPPDEVAQLAAIELLRAKFGVAEEEDWDDAWVRWRVFSLGPDGQLQSTVQQRDIPQ